ncbi:MAG: tetratricopeptide repeat protein [Candidatus Eisenbacteria bacterium]
MIRPSEEPAAQILGPETGTGPALRIPAWRRLVPWIFVLVVGVIAFAAFSPALDAEFVNFDDDRLFLRNPMYRGFGASELRWMFTTAFMGHYQPLTWMSSALDHAISGIDPSSYHRNNLILHALNGILFYLVAGTLLALARRSRPGPGRQDIDPRFARRPGAWPLSMHLAAAVAALVFAVHPLRVESVAWASERRDVLSGFFFLAALYSYLRSVHPGQAELASRRWYIASILTLACSLLSKAWGMSFFILVLLLDLYPLRRLPESSLRRRWFSSEARPVCRQKLPYLLLGVGAAALAGASQGGALQTMKSLSEWGLADRIAQACFGLVFYVGKTLWPSGLVALYELPADMDPFAARYVLSYAAVVAGIAALIALRRRMPWLVVAAAAYAVVLAPVLGFAQSGPQLVADKYSYISCMSFAVLAGAGFLRLWERRGAGRWLALVLGLAVTIALLPLTHRQTRVWHNSETLWAHALERGRPTAGAHLNYGIVLQQGGREEEALEHFRRAVEIRPQEGEVWYQLGNALRRARLFAEAEEAYRRAAATMPLKHQAYMNLGILQYSQNRPEEAAVSLQAAVDNVGPLFGSSGFTARPYLLLGNVLQELGRLPEARRWLEVAARFPETRDEARRQLETLPSSKPAPPAPALQLDPPAEPR